MNLDELRSQVGLLSRSQKLEILAKAGLMLRKALAKDQERVGDFRMISYLCPTECIEEYDKIVDILKEKGSEGDNSPGRK